MADKTVKAVRFDMERTAGPSSDEGENVLQDRNETSDVTLVIEGRELYANRGVLAHFSPVFHAMFFSASGLKEKSQEKVELPEKKFQDMVTLFNVLLMPPASARCQVSDETLLLLLALADEYQMDQVKAVCQDYIGGQLFDHFKSFFRFYTNTESPAGPSDGYPIPKGSMRGQKIDRKSLIDKLLLYHKACGQYYLPAYWGEIRDLLMAVTRSRSDLSKSQHYQSLPQDTQNDLLDMLRDKTFDRGHLDDPEHNDRDGDDPQNGDGDVDLSTKERKRERKREQKQKRKRKRNMQTSMIDMNKRTGLPMGYPYEARYAYAKWALGGHTPTLRLPWDTLPYRVPAAPTTPSQIMAAAGLGTSALGVVTPLSPSSNRDVLSITTEPWISTASRQRDEYGT